MIQKYYDLAKPGIVYGNVFTTLASFLFASHWHAPLVLFLATMSGVALVIASACVVNNYTDRNIDQKMARTSSRAFAVGGVSTMWAFVYALVLGCTGAFMLFQYLNLLTMCIALCGFVIYVGPYGLAKRMSHWGTVVGSVAGAAPIVAGYTAVVGRLDATALILFVILALWQMPHFYAIALYRLDDYAKAKIPVLPVQHGVRTTKIYIVMYTTAFGVALLSLGVCGYAGRAYTAGAALVGGAWLWFALRGLVFEHYAPWARKFFFASLIVLVLFCAMLALSPLLP
jgi:protoheme IX farnesyltransferase